MAQEYLFWVEGASSRGVLGTRACWRLEREAHGAAAGAKRHEMCRGQVSGRGEGTELEGGSVRGEGKEPGKEWASRVGPGTEAAVEELG